LRLAASAESGSDHPISRAVVDAAVEASQALAPAEQFESHVALGVSAVVEGRTVIVGNLAMVESAGIESAESSHAAARLEAQGRTVLFVAVDRELAGVLGVFDNVKAGAARAVSALKDLGVRVVMMTGDNERAAVAVASSTRITEFHAGARPEDKLRLVEELQAGGLTIAMVGDGINDAPALAKADLGIAMSTGTDVAIEASDITLLHGDVSKIAEAVLLGRSTLAAIRQNLFWAFGYNVVAIPIAAAGLLNPIIAGAAMALSSVSVMANSLRLRGKGRSIAERAGNTYRGERFSLYAANRGPALSLVAATLVLVLPLVVFTGIDRGWFGNDGNSSSAEEQHEPVHTG
jgi:Cu+-exporting ATPase